MKSKNLFTILFTCLFFCNDANFVYAQVFNAQDFKTPNLNYRVHIWWHWNGGRITKEGITKDLESMKEQGISQATILNIGASYGKEVKIKEVFFDTEEWYGMFKWSLQEANRLGIAIGVHNCDGWSSSGGPWIKPENAMKRFVFTKTATTAKQKAIKLQKPYCETDFYRDIAVIAFKKNSMQEMGSRPVFPKSMMMNDSKNAMMLVDGDPESKIEIKDGYIFNIDNPTKALKTKISFLQNYVGVFYYPKTPTADYTIKTSDDGIHYKEIAKVAVKKFFTADIIEIPETNAPFFKVEVSKINNLKPWHHMGLSELQLLGKNEQPRYNPSIQNPLEKSSSVRVYNESVLYSTNQEISAENIISENDIIDLTSKMQPDGTLNWTAPSGNWEVIRFGYTSRDAMNISSTKEGHGLEVDKMDTTALNFHFKSFSQKLIDHSGKFKGNTFKFLLIDSWEAGYQTWTSGMEDKFEQLRGYNLKKWIPVLCGETVQNSEDSNAFLHDFRQTIADLIEKNYYRHFRDLTHRNGLEFHSEAIYGNTYPAPPLDELKVNGMLDMPMTEFWAPVNNQSMVQYKPSKKSMPYFAVYAPNFYPIKSVGAEAFTGNAHYSESFKDLKLFGDREYAAGISQMVLHSYAHQPDDVKPGFTLGNHASHFNRNNPAWNFGRGWVDYQSRIQYALQETTIPAQILYYLGEQFPQFISNKAIDNLPDGYQSVPCNLEILKQANVVDGKISFSKNQTYAVLILPDRRYLSFEAIKKIEELVSAGATVYGEKPLGSLSFLDGNNNDFTKYIDQMWSGYTEGSTGENVYGKGKIIWEKPISRLLADLHIKPNFSTQMADAEKILFIHESKPDADVFFVVNQTDSTLNRVCFFGTNYRSPEIWNPVNGKTQKLGLYTVEEGGLRIPITLKAKESLIFVFNQNENNEFVNKVELGGVQIFPSINGVFDNDVPEVILKPTGEWNYISNITGKYTFTTNTGKKNTLNLNAPIIHEIKDFKGKLELHPINGDKTNSIAISTLKSLTDFSQPEIKYFAGEASYQINFDLPASFTSKKGEVYLSLGELDAAAEVILNGKSLGNAWMPHTWLSTTMLLERNNHLEIKLGTTVRNRFIGDFKEYGKLKNVFSTANVASYLNKESVLKPTGVIGPLRLIKYNNVSNSDKK